MTKEHPIIFNGPMVRAILAGRKTQTRRVMKPQPDPDGKVDVGEIGSTRGFAYVRGSRGGRCTKIPCPYGQPGDRLWVRETWALTDQAGYHEADAWPVYRADDPDWETMEGWRWRPSIHMPRWASRITLEITDVHVERLQDISAGDAAAEGVDGVVSVAITHDPVPSRNAFRVLWDSINAKRGYGWDANPWVWVIEFRVLHSQQPSSSGTAPPSPAALPGSVAGGH